MLLIKRKLVRCISKNEICANIGWDNSAADNRVIFFTAAVNLPCGLKQFEEFARCSPMLKIRGNGDHISFAIAGLRSLPGWSTLVRNIAEARLKEAHLRHPRTA